MKSSIVLVLAAALLAAAAPSTGGEKVLDVRVAPGPAPKDLVIQAFIERDPRNRALQFVVDSGDFYGSSTSELEGDRAPRAQEARFRRVPGGEYQVIVRLMSADGERARSVVTVAVF